MHKKMGGLAEGLGDRDAAERQSEGPEPATGGAVRELRPYDRSRCAEHGGLFACYPRCARPTGDSHTRTTRGRAQRRGGRKAKAALSNQGEAEQRGQQHTHYKGKAGTPQRIPRPEGYA